MGCDRHPYDRATSACRLCHAPFCAECLVWADGEEQPPTCIRCALVSRVGAATRSDRRAPRRPRLLAGA